MGKRRVIGVLLAAGLVTGVCGCAVPAPPSGSHRGGLGPLGDRILDTDLSAGARQAADREMLRQQGVNSLGRLEVLSHILESSAEAEDMRLYALEQLRVLAGSTDFRNRELLVDLLGMVLGQAQGGLLASDCTFAIELGDPKLIEALARSLDRELPDDQPPRPELAAIAALSGKPAVEALAEVVRHASTWVPRVAALDDLQRLESPEEVRTWIGQVQPAGDDRWLVDVKNWTSSMGAVPEGINEFGWEAWLEGDGHADYLRQVLAHHRIIAGQADDVAAPRFAATLAASDEAMLRLPRAQLLAELAEKLNALKHVRREPSSQGAIDDVPETLASAQARLARGDLLNLRMLLEWLAQSGAAAEILRIGSDDRADATSEHGGVLGLRDGRIELQVLPPMFTGNDMSYVTPDAALERVPTSLALFHLHFAAPDSSQNAGPGVGDLRFAHDNRVSCVVLTSLDAKTFDADYYTPDGAVVDLGVYHGGD